VRHLVLVSIPFRRDGSHPEVVAAMLVFADADSVRPAHIVEFYGLLGGGLRDAGWDGSARPTARLAILPGTTHYDIYAAPGLTPAVIAFLDAAA
jgi:hypothetical protein